MGDLVLLDRDGVINFDSIDYIKSAAEWVPIPGSLEAIASLTRAGFTVAVVSNQSGLGRGLFTDRDLEGIDAKMTAAVAAAGGRIAGIFYCPHRPGEGCRCRKPAPGLLEQASRELGVGLEGAPVVGDKVSDVEAARAVGGRPMLVLTGKGLAAQAALGEEVEVYADLRAAAEHLLAERGA